jgi:hypothetical protein
VNKMEISVRKMILVFFGTQCVDQAITACSVIGVLRTAQLAWLTWASPAVKML